MKNPTVTNLFHPLPPAGKDEIFEVLARGRDALVERIVSHGQATPAGTWLKQEAAEWVVLLRGKARILFHDSDKGIDLEPGDALTIPAGVEHRVAMTDPNIPSVWLAVHFTA